MRLLWLFALGLVHLSVAPLWQKKSQVTHRGVVQVFSPVKQWSYGSQQSQVFGQTLQLKERAPLFKIHGGVHMWSLCSPPDHRRCRLTLHDPIPSINRICTSALNISSLKFLAEDKNLNIPVPQSRCTEVFARTAVNSEGMSCGMP